MENKKVLQNKKVKGEKQQVPIEKILLGIIAAAGLISMIALAPGAGPALRVFGVGKKDKKYYQNAVSRLKQKGYICFVQKDGYTYLRITKEGKKQLDKYTKGAAKIKKPKRWDGKWRIVSFDIPEKKRRIRNQIRNELKAIGFVELQKSVWIYPYDCEEFVKLLKADKRIGRYVLYVVAESVEYDKRFRNHFSL